MQIDLGSRDGLREKPARADHRRIGWPRQFPVSLTPARKSFSSGIRTAVFRPTVENPARDMGVVIAGSPVDTSFACNLIFFASGANLKPGTGCVVTSGLGGVFPKGIPIGQVIDSRLVEYGLYTEARVKLNANIGALEQVWVLFP